MITAAKLKAQTVKQLASMAKKKQVVGWHSMRKDELVQALVRCAKSAAARKRRKEVITPGKKISTKGASQSPAKPPKKALTPYAQRRLRKIKDALAEAKDLALKSMAEGNGVAKDRIVVMVRDPYWLHVHWELNRASVDRAQAALGQYWHGSRPVLRLFELDRNGTTSSASRLVRSIEIHGGVTDWYIDVKDPPKSYRVEIGYLARNDRFLSLARSNIVTTPLAGVSDSFDKNWSEEAKDFDRVYAMSGGYTGNNGNTDLKDVLEENLRRPMGDPVATRFGIGAASRNGKDFSFEVNTELIVHGVASPDSRVTLRGEPVHLREDGSFAVRFSLPNRRHVLPVVACSGDGVEQRTIVLAVDRNTKVMEPVIRDPSV